MCESWVKISIPFFKSFLSNCSLNHLFCLIIYSICITSFAFSWNFCRLPQFKEEPKSNVGTNMKKVLWIFFILACLITMALPFAFYFVGVLFPIRLVVLLFLFHVCYIVVVLTVAVGFPFSFIIF